MTVVESSETLMHLSGNVEWGGLLVLAALGYVLYSVVLVWRRKHERHLRFVRFLIAGVLLATIPLSLHFGVRTLDVRFDLAKDEVSIVETSALGLRSRDVHLPLAGLRCDAQVVTYRGGRQKAHLVVSSATHSEALLEPPSGDVEGERKLVATIRAFLAKER